MHKNWASKTNFENDARKQFFAATLDLVNTEYYWDMSISFQPLETAFSHCNGEKLSCHQAMVKSLVLAEQQVSKLLSEIQEEIASMEPPLTNRFSAELPGNEYDGHTQAWLCEALQGGYSLSTPPLYENIHLCIWRVYKGASPGLKQELEWACRTLVEDFFEDLEKKPCDHTMSEDDIKYIAELSLLVASIGIVECADFLRGYVLSDQHSFHKLPVSVRHSIFNVLANVTPEAQDMGFWWCLLNENTYQYSRSAFRGAMRYDVVQAMQLLPHLTDTSQFFVCNQIDFAWDDANNSVRKEMLAAVKAHYRIWRNPGEFAAWLAEKEATLTPAEIDVAQQIAADREKLEQDIGQIHNLISQLPDDILQEKIAEFNKRLKVLNKMVKQQNEKE